MLCESARGTEQPIQLTGLRALRRRYRGSQEALQIGGTEPGGLPCDNPSTQCFVNPLVVQNNQYSSQAYALYEGAIVEVKKRFRSEALSLAACPVITQALNAL